LFSILVLILAALSSAVLADAQPGSPAPAVSPAEHLLVVPKTADGVVALARADARVVARYESFALVEAAGEDERRLRDAGAQRRDDMREVATAAGDFDPDSDRASLAGKRAPDRDEVLALVQFVGPLKDAWVERLRATGARIVTYQAENAYVVHAGGEAAERVAELVGADPAVRAVIPLGARDKLEGRASGTARYAVSTVDGPGTRVGAQHIQHLELSATEVDRLARDPAVVAIERELPPKPTDERTSQIVAGNLTPFLAPSGPGYLAWYDPRFPSPFTFAIDVTDSGIDDGMDTPDHPDFYELGSTSLPDRINYQLNYSGDSEIRDCTGHGTNVASIAAGYNSGGGGANVRPRASRVPSLFASSSIVLRSSPL